MIAAQVSLGDLVVGVLGREGNQFRFEPAESWAELPEGVRPVLGQQFEDDPLAAHVGRPHRGLPLWFEHLLPEQGGPLRNALASKLEVDPEDGFAMLVGLGEDLPGAVRVRALEVNSSVVTVAKRIQDMPAPLSLPRTALRISLAGVQFKMSLRVVKGRLTAPTVDDEGDWIVKYSDLALSDLPATEFVTMAWAAESGLRVPRTKLVPVEEIQGVDAADVAGYAPIAFAIERYDRAPGHRIHQEDFAQVLGLPVGNGKYEQTNLDTIIKLVHKVSPGDVDDLLSRIVFSVLSGNDDAHAKNWSLWYPDATGPRLAPVYDQVCTLSFPQYANNQMALYMAGVRNFQQVTLDRFRQLALRIGLDSSRVEDVVRDAVRAQVAAWSRVREGPEVSSTLRIFLDDWLAGLPLVREIIGR